MCFKSNKDTQITINYVGKQWFIRILSCGIEMARRQGMGRSTRFEGMGSSVNSLRVALHFDRQYGSFHKSQKNPDSDILLSFLSRIEVFTGYSRYW